MKKFLQNLFLLFLVLSFYSGNAQENIAVIPFPQKVEFHKEKYCTDNLSFYTRDSELKNLFQVLKQEFFILTKDSLSIAKNEKEASVVANVNPNLAKEEYRIEIKENIEVTGGSYDAVAMGSITLLQLMEDFESPHCWQQGFVQDAPEFAFRGLLIDLARRKHDLATIKRVIMLCRWYKINYLQLHLTDENYFTFPSKAYPQLSTKGWAYTKEELKNLVDFANDRGVQIIPELEVPGHAGQFVEQMSDVFGFSDPEIHPYTIHMGRERVYSVLDTLIGEIADVFYSSEYIHIGGDEANFRKMEKDREIQKFLQQKRLQNIEELYWYFLNRMNSIVKKHGKKTIVWEGFSKEGNSVVDKDIVVMAWETLYQLPQDILEAGYKTINVSWKPLYVVNQRKWSPQEIFNWNIYRWENWVPSIPSYDPIQLEPHPGLIGASMASWDQPAYTEISSLKKRIPAMVEEAWNHSGKASFEEFQKRLAITNREFENYLTPIDIEVKGLTYPEIEDGHKDEQTWFDDQVFISLFSKRPLVIRYSIDGSPVTPASSKYVKPIIFFEDTELRYQAFKDNKPVGAEMLRYYELHPLRVDLEADFTIPLEELWDTTHPNTIKFENEVKIDLTAAREGEIKYVIGDNELNESSKNFIYPLIIEDNTLIKAGLFVNGKQIGQTWKQYFKNE